MFFFAGFIVSIRLRFISLGFLPPIRAWDCVYVFTVDVGLIYVISSR